MQIERVKTANNTKTSSGYDIRELLTSSHKLNAWLDVKSTIRLPAFLTFLRNPNFRDQGTLGYRGETLWSLIYSIGFYRRSICRKEEEVEVSGGSVIRKCNGFQEAEGISRRSLASILFSRGGYLTLALSRSCCRATVGRTMAGAGAVVPVQIDAWSDVACPWCYVGKVRLDQAIQNLQEKGGESPTQVSVRWHPYMIDMNTNPAGESYKSYTQRRWGGDSWTQNLRKSGARNGLKFGDWRWWPNTLTAHRLVLLADTVGKGAEAKQKLFEKTYEEGLNVSDVNVVSNIAEELGLPNAREYFTSGTGRGEVLEQVEAATTDLGIHSVPYFVLDNKFVLSGAQDVATFEDAIRKAASMHSASGRS